MPSEASLRVIFAQRDKSSRLYRYSYDDQREKVLTCSESCQQVLLNGIAVDQSERAGRTFETAVSDDGINSEEIPQPREARRKSQKKQVGGNQKPEPQLEQRHDRVQPELGRCLDQFLGEKAFLPGERRSEEHT